MNAKQFIILLTVTFLSLLTISSVMFYDDFQEGWSAYVKKDYETAHRLWLPLAEQGNSSNELTKLLIYGGLDHAN